MVIEPFWSENGSLPACLKLGRKNHIFLSDNGYGFKKVGGTPPLQILRSTPGGGLTIVLKKTFSNNFLCWFSPLKKISSCM